MDDSEKARKLDAVDKLVEALLEESSRNVRRSPPGQDDYSQGKKDAYRMVLAMIREDPSIVTDVTGF